jgi:hypothetical protein
VVFLVSQDYQELETETETETGIETEAEIMGDELGPKAEVEHLNVVLELEELLAVVLR